MLAKILGTIFPISDQRYQALQHEIHRNPLTFVFVIKWSVDFRIWGLSWCQHLVAFTGTTPVTSVVAPDAVCVESVYFYIENNQHACLNTPAFNKAPAHSISNNPYFAPFTCCVSSHRVWNVIIGVWESVCVSGQERAEAGVVFDKAKVQKQAHFCNLIFHCLHIWSCM